MCGIAGFTGPIDANLLDRMLDSIAHRGPDGVGQLKKPEFSFGMRRLAIIDPNGGWQPIWNEDKTVALVFNGEIYNYQEIWNELVQKGHQFATDHSDTETIVHGYEEWGIDILQRLRGMFGFALWDQKKNKLFIARDRLGIKPLYYAISDDRFFFASEIKALTKAALVNRAPDEASIYKFLRYRLHDSGESTFFANVKRLLPAHYMELDLSDPTKNIKTTKYWSPEINTKFKGDKTDDEYAQSFRETFLETIKLHLISDVPLGVSLSGGLDSSGIASSAALLRTQGSDTHTNQLLTFSAVFPGQTIDETSYIEEVVRHTNAKMYTVNPTVEGFWNEIDTWIYFQEEPTISSAPYAYYSVYRLAQEHVKVVLSGNGGDELLAGYIPYFQAYLSTARAQGYNWDALREIVSGIDLYFPYFRQIVNRKLQSEEVSITPLLQKSFVDKYLNLPELNFENLPNLNERLWKDVTYSSVPNLTRYDDRNSMAFSIESRPAFLDHKLVEFIMQLPIDQKIKHGWNRYVYRNAMKGIMPEKNRKRRSKIGFTNPELNWLRAGVDKYRSVFSSKSFEERPYWNAALVRSDFEKVLAGANGDILTFWRILNVELWLRQYCD